jgi:hypothetical protein
LQAIHNITSPSYREYVFKIQELIHKRQASTALQWVRGQLVVRGNQVEDRAANMGHLHAQSALSTLSLEESLTVLEANYKSTGQEHGRLLLLAPRRELF